MTGEIRMTTLADRDRDPRSRQRRQSAARAPVPSSLVTEAARKLRGAIMTGRLLPGGKLIESDLAIELCISRATVREVLQALQGERLIELIPNKGPSVAKLGPREIDDIEQVWMLLTADVLTRFAGNRKVADLSALKRRLRHVRAALERGRSLEAIDAINAFFWYIIQRCGNAVLLDVVVSLVSRLNFLRAQSLRDERWRGVCANEIGAILEALNAGNPVAAKSATCVHIASTCQAARDVAIACDSEADSDVDRVAPQALPRIPLDEYLGRGLASGDASTSTTRMRTLRR